VKKLLLVTTFLMVVSAPAFAGGKCPADAINAKVAVFNAIGAEGQRIRARNMAKTNLTGDAFTDCSAEWLSAAHRRIAISNEILAMASGKSCVGGIEDQVRLKAGMEKYVAICAAGGGTPIPTQRAEARSEQRADNHPSPRREEPKKSPAPQPSPKPQSSASSTNYPHVTKNSAERTGGGCVNGTQDCHLPDGPGAGTAKPNYKLTPSQDHPAEKRALAEDALRQANMGVAASKSAKGQDLLNVLLDIEQQFRQAGNFYAQAGDDEQRDLAYHEAARLALIRFIEERAAGKEWAQGAKGCQAGFRHFKTIDDEDSRAVSLVNRIKSRCNWKKEDEDPEFVYDKSKTKRENLAIYQAKKKKDSIAGVCAYMKRVGMKVFKIHDNETIDYAKDCT
jgi:hypothetical protein